MVSNWNVLSMMLWMVWELDLLPAEKSVTTPDMLDFIKQYRQDGEE